MNTQATPPPSVLRRLERETPRKIQLWGTLLTGTVLLSAAAGGLASLWLVDVQDSRLPLTAMVVLFGGLGLCITGVFLHQSFAIWVPETIVEIERGAIRPGKSIRVCFQQPGPLRLASLKANVVCLELLDRPSDTTQAEKLIYSQCILDSGPKLILAGASHVCQIDFCLPPSVHASGRDRCDAKRSYVWKIEVWGRVRWWPGFMHAYLIRVASS